MLVINYCFDFVRSLSIFNFGWGRNSQGRHEMSLVSSVVTVGFLMDVLNGLAFDIRLGYRAFERRAVKLLDFIGRKAKPEPRPWTVGIEQFAGLTVDKNGHLVPAYANSISRAPSLSTAAGWHCSWCLPIGGIQTKMTSAQNGDFPRWGNFPSKLDPVYIRRLINCGLWFDDETRLQRVDAPFVPRAVIDNPLRYGYLLPEPDDSLRTDTCRQARQQQQQQQLTTVAE
jgi:hypothetical protein